MTTAELLGAVGAALAVAFAGDDWAVWPVPPDATAVPAVWPELAASSATGSRAAGCAMTVQCVAAIAAQVHAAEYGRIADAHDRLDTITAGALGAQIAARTAVVAAVDIGGIEHTALLYSLTIDRPPQC